MTLTALTTPFGFTFTQAQRAEENRLTAMGESLNRGSFDMVSSFLTPIKYIPVLGSLVAYSQWKKTGLVLKSFSKIEKYEIEKYKSNIYLHYNSQQITDIQCNKKPTDRATLVIYKIRLFMEILGLGLLFFPLDLVVTGGRAVGALYQRITQSKVASKVDFGPVIYVAQKV